MTEYVNFCDFEKQIVYAGYVCLFSETDKLRELVLREVKIYDFDGRQLFQMPYIYISRKAVTCILSSLMIRTHEEMSKMSVNKHTGPSGKPQITEGYVRRGGIKPSTSQIPNRPPAPPPMRPSDGSAIVIRRVERWQRDVAQHRPLFKVSSGQVYALPARSPNNPKPRARRVGGP